MRRRVVVACICGSAAVIGVRFGGVDGSGNAGCIVVMSVVVMSTEVVI